jgi:hypothetical protein
MNLRTRTIAVIGLANRISELQAGHDHTLEVSEDELRQAKQLMFTSDSSSLRGARNGQATQTQHWCGHRYEFARVCEPRYRYHGPIGSNIQAI